MEESVIYDNADIVTWGTSSKAGDGGRAGSSLGSEGPVLTFKCVSVTVDSNVGCIAGVVCWCAEKLWSRAYYALERHRRYKLVVVQPRSFAG